MTKVWLKRGRNRILCNLNVMISVAYQIEHMRLYPNYLEMSEFMEVTEWRNNESIISFLFPSFLGTNLKREMGAMIVGSAI